MASRAAIKHGPGSVVGWLETGFVSGQACAAGGYLLFGLRLWLEPKEPRVRLFSLSGELFLRQPRVLYVGSLTPTGGGLNSETSPGSSDKADLTLGIHLSSEVLLELERAREVQPALEMELRLQVALASRAETASSSVWLQQTVGQEAWIKCLTEMRWEQRHLIEVPIRGGRVAGQLATASEHLRNAIELQRERKWRSAVTEARNGFEALRQGLGLKDPPDGVREAVARAWPLASRVERLRAVAHKVCHLASHAGVAERFGPAEAQLAVSQLGVLVAYYASTEPGETSDDAASPEAS